MGSMRRGKMHADVAEKQRPYARKVRFVTAKHLDRRTIAARRAAAMAKEFEAELGGNLSVTQRAAIDRAATLAACAEDCRVRCLAGDPSVNLDDLVRLERLADLAVRRLGIGRVRQSEAPSLDRYLGAKHGGTVAA